MRRDGRGSSTRDIALGNLEINDIQETDTLDQRALIRAINEGFRRTSLEVSANFREAYPPVTVHVTANGTTGVMINQLSNDEVVAMAVLYVGSGNVDLTPAIDTVTIGTGAPYQFATGVGGIEVFDAPNALGNLAFLELTVANISGGDVVASFYLRRLG